MSSANHGTTNLSWPPERGTASPYDAQIPIPIKLWPAQQQKPSGTDTGSQGGTKAQCQDAVAQEADCVIGATMLQPVSSAQRVLDTKSIDSYGDSPVLVPWLRIKLDPVWALGNSW
jgi:hypothetical protein